ncbi:MAG: hypothetical protein L3J46_03250 [Kangiellaceae bacterium]|nr:hypothetical protein [Kangiellaceae bacterium]
MLNFNEIMASLRFLLRKRLSISPETIDTRIRDYQFQITEESAVSYHEVISQEHSSDDKYLVHPLYLTKVSWHIVESLNDYLKTPIEPKLLEMLVHLSNHFEFFAPLELNKKYTVKSHLCQIKPHRKGTRLTVRFDYWLEDKLVASEHTTGLLFGVRCRGEGIMREELPSYPRVIETAIWSKSIPIEKCLPYVYAKKAEIDAPIHTDPKFAKSIGLPDIILQGTCTFAMSVNCILVELKIATKEVKCLSVNFTGMLLTPNEIKIDIVFQTEQKIVFNVYDNKGNALIKGGNIIFANK